MSYYVLPVQFSLRGAIQRKEVPPWVFELLVKNSPVKSAKPSINLMNEWVNLRRYI